MLLIEKVQTFPKTHDLKALHELCEHAGILVAISSADLYSLSTYAVRVRYPGDPVLRACLKSYPNLRISMLSEAKNLRAASF